MVANSFRSRRPCGIPRFHNDSATKHRSSDGSQEGSEANQRRGQTISNNGLSMASASEQEAGPHLSKKESLLSKRQKFESLMAGLVAKQTKKSKTEPISENQISKQEDIESREPHATTVSTLLESTKDERIDFPQEKRLKADDTKDFLQHLRQKAQRNLNFLGSSTRASSSAAVSNGTSPFRSASQQTSQITTTDKSAQEYILGSCSTFIKQAKEKRQQLSDHPVGQSFSHSEVDRTSQDSSDAASGRSPANNSIGNSSSRLQRSVASLSTRRQDNTQRRLALANSSGSFDTRDRPNVPRPERVGSGVVKKSAGTYKALREKSAKRIQELRELREKGRKGEDRANSTGYGNSGTLSYPVKRAMSWGEAGLSGKDVATDKPYPRHPREAAVPLDRSKRTMSWDEATREATLQSNNTIQKSSENDYADITQESNAYADRSREDQVLRKSIRPHSKTSCGEEKISVTRSGRDPPEFGSDKHPQSSAKAATRQDIICLVDSEIELEFEEEAQDTRAGNGSVGFGKDLDGRNTSMFTSENHRPRKTSTFFEDMKQGRNIKDSLKHLRQTIKDTKHQKKKSTGSQSSEEIIFVEDKGDTNKQRFPIEPSYSAEEEVIFVEDADHEKKELDRKRRAEAIAQDHNRMEVIRNPVLSPITMEGLWTEHSSETDSYSSYTPDKLIGADLVFRDGYSIQQQPQSSSSRHERQSKKNTKSTQSNKGGATPEPKSFFSHCAKTLKEEWNVTTRNLVKSPCTLRHLSVSAIEEGIEEDTTSENPTTTQNGRGVHQRRDNNIIVSTVTSSSSGESRNVSKEAQIFQQKDHKDAPRSPPGITRSDPSNASTNSKRKPKSSRAPDKKNDIPTQLSALLESVGTQFVPSSILAMSKSKFDAPAAPEWAVKNNFDFAHEVKDFSESIGMQVGRVDAPGKEIITESKLRSMEEKLSEKRNEERKYSVTDVKNQSEDAADPPMESYRDFIKEQKTPDNFCELQYHLSDLTYAAEGFFQPNCALPGVQAESTMRSNLLQSPVISNFLSRMQEGRNTSIQQTMEERKPNPYAAKEAFNERVTSNASCGSKNKSYTIVSQISGLTDPINRYTGYHNEPREDHFVAETGLLNDPSNVTDDYSDTLSIDAESFATELERNKELFGRRVSPLTLPPESPRDTYAGTRSYRQQFPAKPNGYSRDEFNTVPNNTSSAKNKSLLVPQMGDMAVDLRKKETINVETLAAQYGQMGFTKYGVFSGDKAKHIVSRPDDMSSLSESTDMDSVASSFMTSVLVKRGAILNRLSSVSESDSDDSSSEASNESRPSAASRKLDPPSGSDSDYSNLSNTETSSTLNTNEDSGSPENVAARDEKSFHGNPLKKLLSRPRIGSRKRNETGHSITKAGTTHNQASILAGRKPASSAANKHDGQIVPKSAYHFDDGLNNIQSWIGNCGSPVELQVSASDGSKAPPEDDIAKSENAGGGAVDNIDKFVLNSWGLLNRVEQLRENLSPGAYSRAATNGSNAKSMPSVTENDDDEEDEEEDEEEANDGEDADISSVSGSSNGSFLSFEMQNSKIDARIGIAPTMETEKAYFKGARAQPSTPNTLRAFQSMSWKPEEDEDEEVYADNSIVASVSGQDDTGSGISSTSDYSYSQMSGQPNESRTSTREEDD